ncbi:MAG: MBL fold metallo-hydrolase [Bacteroidia bacterium]|jgi:hypothetical protein|nr:MBL fold metallo-hydrolase [Bacteroidia bacterium]
MTKIKFINHASYILCHENIKLICDPWIEGTAFHEGCRLIEPTRFKYSDFSGITHIWFSHEHPDHFSPPNLKSIPLEIRKNITILFQETKDKKVINFCRTLGFKDCIELRKNWYELTPSFKILNLPHSDGDSWMCAKVGEYTVLNINDCVLEDDKQISNIILKTNSEKIDVLLTQFSYANWAGNIEDNETRKKFAAQKLKEIERQVLIFKPRYTIPFASFVWFCHQENFYMNDEVNKIDFIYNFIQEKLNTKPIVLFPNDEWYINKEHDSITSISKWVNSYDLNVVIENTIEPSLIEGAQLVKLGNNFIDNLIKNNSKWMKFFLKPSSIFIDDHNCSYKLSLQGFERADLNQENCDISMSSDSLQYCFKFLWGGATTRINGRYQVPKNGRFYNWKLYFQISELNNHGEKFGLKFILVSLYRNLRRKIYVR